jgi:hypothetical protein
MKIDLSQFVGKTVKVTYTSGKEAFGVITVRKFLPSQSLSYRLVDENQNRISDHYVSGKCYYFRKTSDIVKIQLSTPEQPKQMPNTLESETLHAIASTLTPEAINYIESHDKYAEVMVNLLEEFLEKNLGNSTGELPFMIFDRIFLNKGTN